MDLTQYTRLTTTLQIARQLIVMHEYDQNFPRAILDRLVEFRSNPDVMANPVKHADLIREVKMECLLATENSPYVEVRANVDATDDPTLPVFTIRVWIIGVIFSAAGSFIDTLFGYRNPPVYVASNVGQLVSCELIQRVLSITPTREIADADIVLFQTLAESSWRRYSLTGDSDYSARNTVSTPDLSTRRNTCSSLSCAACPSVRPIPTTSSPRRHSPYSLARNGPSAAVTSS